jgi:hypothetical protein
MIRPGIRSFKSPDDWGQAELPRNNEIAWRSKFGAPDAFVMAWELPNYRHLYQVTDGLLNDW